MLMAEEESKWAKKQEVAPGISALGRKENVNP